MPMRLEVEGAGRLVDALSKFNKEIYKILQDDVRAAAGLVAEDAKRRFPDKPISGWGPWTLTTGTTGSSGSITFETGSRDLSYDSGTVTRSVRPGARKARVRGVGTTGIRGIVSITSAGGAIFSTAGHRTPDSPFNRTIVSRFGNDYPRALKPALFAKGPQAANMIDDALERAQARFGLS